MKVFFPHFVFLLALSPFLLAQDFKQPFNDGWKFARFGQLHNLRKKTEPRDPQSTAFDDSSWQELTLPHDWAIQGPFNIKLDTKMGKLPCVGIGWYRKSFSLPETDREKSIFLDIDGAMANSKIHLNGHEISYWLNGYTPYQVELPKEHLKYGEEENLLAIRLEVKPESSRWYTGGGLYRNVWLTKKNPIHFTHNGVFIRNFLPTEGSDFQCEVLVDLNQHTEGLSLAVKATQEGKEIGKIEGQVLNEKTQNFLLNLSSPQLWSTNAPHLTHFEVGLYKGEQLVDQVNVTSGVRTIDFYSNEGFHLNGKPVELKGVCLRHDLGPLGAAFYTRAAERQIELLKEMGCNAIRPLFTPPAPEFVELCDRHGMLLCIDPFNGWGRTFKKNEYGSQFKAWHEKDLTMVIGKYRNSPSVIMWNIGTQNFGLDRRGLLPWAQPLGELTKNLDPSRAVLLCSPVERPKEIKLRNIDIYGVHYRPAFYSNIHSKLRGKPMLGSETTATVSSRGEYIFPMQWNKRAGYRLKTFQVSSYDRSAPQWGFPAEIELKYMKESRPWNMGHFVLSGFDYLGDSWPYLPDFITQFMLADDHPAKDDSPPKESLSKARSTYYGILDLCGFKKDRFYLYHSEWKEDTQVAHLLPHWNWPEERIGEVTPVHLYTNGDEAELFLNGKTKGRIKKGDTSKNQKSQFRIHWDHVKYEPGELKAVVYKDGKPWTETTIQTTGEPAMVTLTADRNSIQADGKDLAFVTATIRDASGLAVPPAGNKLSFTLEGKGRILATGNGNAADLTSFNSANRNAFNSLCLVIIAIDEPGPVTLNVKSMGLAGAQVQLQGITQ